MSAGLRERLEAVRASAAKAATQSDYTAAGEKAIRMIPEILAIIDADADGGAAAVVCKEGFGPYSIDMLDVDNWTRLPHGTKLYTHPARSGVVSDDQMQGAIEAYYAYVGDDDPPSLDGMRAAPPASPAGVPDVSAMVNRFLGWKLPKDFAPDAGISFTPGPTQHLPHCWPTGTNLFTATQAQALFEYVIAVAPQPGES